MLTVINGVDGVCAGCVVGLATGEGYLNLNTAPSCMKWMDTSAHNVTMLAKKGTAKHQKDPHELQSLGALEY